MKKLLFGTFFFFLASCVGSALILGLFSKPESIVNSTGALRDSDEEQMHRSSSKRINKKHKLPISKVKVDDSLLLKLNLVRTHLTYLAIEIERLPKIPIAAATWTPLTVATESACAECRKEVTSLKSDLANNYTNAPEEVVSLIQDMISNIENAIDDPSVAGRTKSAVLKANNKLNNMMESESSGSSIPESDLLKWTKERIFELANYPSTVKFGWFPEVMGGEDNSSAQIAGSFKASNAFGLELKHEYVATWEVSDSKQDSRTWQMVWLKIDGETVFESADAATRWEREIIEASSIGEIWTNRRNNLAIAFTDVSVAVENWSRWKSEAREFISDKGTTIEARFDSVIRTNSKKLVVLEKSDGSKLSVPLERFGESDRKQLAARIRGPVKQAEWENESRLFMSKDDSTLKARIQSASGSGISRKVTLETEDGKSIQVQLNELVPDDQEFIEAEIKRRRKKK